MAKSLLCYDWNKEVLYLTDDVMLTTIDNPFNPFTHYDEWLTYDLQMGYNTNSLLDRVADVTEELSDEDYDSIVFEAMKEICKINVLGIYKLITKDEKINPYQIKTGLASTLNEQIERQLKDMK